jgi:Tfp pilus assembly protein PilN
MSTTLIPLDPAISLERSTRILTISARLIPQEIVAARRARRTRGWVIVFVAVVACLCGAWFLQSRYQTQQADQELTEALGAVTDLQREQREFSGTVKVRDDTATLTRQLTAVMTNDLDWDALLDTLRIAGAPSKIVIEGVNGTLDAANEADSSIVLPSTDAATSIGSLLVTGAAPDKKAVAAYVDALGAEPVVTNPYVTNVASSDEGGVTFSLKVDITPAALCGRFTVACKSSGGN